MKFLPCLIDGLKIIQLQTHVDARGFFVEQCRREKLVVPGLEADFVQDIGVSAKTHAL